MPAGSDNLDRAEALRENLIALFGVGPPDNESLRAVLGHVAPEDVAEVLDDFDEDKKLLIFRCLPSDEARSVVIEETDSESHDEILEDISPDEKVAVLKEMPVDDLVDHLEELRPDEKAKVLAELEPEEVRDVEELSKFPPDSAGGLMTTEYLSLGVTLTSKEALAEIQGNLDAEVISYVYVTESDGTLRGVLSIRDILRAKPQTPVEEYMVTDVLRVDVETDQEDVAAAANKYNLNVIPVVDGENHMRGVVTADDILDAVEEEHTEDMLRMAGTVTADPFHESIRAGVLKRLPFLSLTMVGGIGIFFMKALFEGEGGIDDPRSLAWALAALPLLCGLSGNVGIVTSTVMVRGIATGDITAKRAWRALGQEVLVGAAIGVVLALVVGMIFPLLPEGSGAAHDAANAGPPPLSSYEITFALMAGLAVSVVWASFIGAMVPFACRASGKIDPAIASGPFVTMLCDLSASFIFLYLVTLFLA